MIDLTPGDGSFGKVAIEHGLTYVAVCFNEQHVEIVKEHIINYVLEKMGSEDGNELYMAKYAAYKKDKDKDKVAVVRDTKEEGEKKGGKRPRGKVGSKAPKTKKSKKDKKTKSSSSSSSSASDSHSDD